MSKTPTSPGVARSASAEDWGRQMKAAIAQAKRACRETGPNPRVGALIVSEGKIISSGYHHRVGAPHAEVEAIRAAGRDVRGMDLVVTLEPCSHFGRTPPCTDLIIESGIRRVIVGTLDPNPKERGAGIRALAEHGVEVLSGVCEPECRTLIESYAKYITTGIPFVTVKLAASLDGRIATRTGNARWLSSAPSRRWVHRMRQCCGAVVVGSGTAVLDDPELTVRLASPRTRPWRVLVSGTLSEPLGLKLFQDQGRFPTLVLCTGDREEKRQRELESQGVTVAVVGGSGEKVDLTSALKELGRREIPDILVEGGAALAGALVDAQLVDRLVLAYAPLVLGRDARPALDLPGVDLVAQAQRYDMEWTRRIGDDVVVAVRMGPDWTRKPWEDA